MSENEDLQFVRIERKKAREAVENLRADVAGLRDDLAYKLALLEVMEQYLEALEQIDG